jgi:ATP dependent DNA ligase C terminal region
LTVCVSENGQDSHNATKRDQKGSKSVHSEHKLCSLRQYFRLRTRKSIGLECGIEGDPRPRRRWSARGSRPKVPRQAIRGVDQAPYKHGAGVRHWCYIPAALGFDALLVSVYENKKRIFVAKVKNGFVPRVRDEIFPTLKTLQTARCPFKNLPEKRASRWGESLTEEKMDQCRWVKPKPVCQVAFLEWTDAGHLRHCTFVAMRDDKKPAGVVRETEPPCRGETSER